MARIHLPSLNSLKRPATLFALVLACGIAAGAWLERGFFLSPEMPVVPLLIQTPNRTVQFTVEVATTPAQLERGLMFRKSLAANAGMLFLFKRDQRVAFWMKNTLIPLDMLFVRSDGLIVRIAHDARPLSERPIPSGRPVIAVLEIAGGRAGELGLRPGDTVANRAVLAMRK